MDTFKNRLIHLLHCRGVGWNTVYQYLKIDPEFKMLYTDKATKIFAKLSPTHYYSILTDLNSKVNKNNITRYKQDQIQLITLIDEEYPEQLKEIYQPPWVIYAKGNISLLKQDLKLAVVGSRQASEYGQNAINHLFPKLIEKGMIIVSGLAAGIDTMAHKGALKYGGNTIGVIAGGFDHIYPRENKALAEEMMSSQLVLSEYPPHTKPSKWQFPMRNRIISGISWGTFIIEAKRKSGSLITANLALNEGREVFALPGSIFNPFSEGTNDLIGQGAKPVISSQDILEEVYH